MTHQPSPTLRLLRQQRLWMTSSLVCLMAFWQIGQPLQAATFVWDSNTGTIGVQDGAGTWSALGTTWWNPSAGSNVAITSTDIGLFGAGGTGGAVTLSGSQSLLGLIFGQTNTTGYSFTAGSATTLTLGASGIAVQQGAQPVTLGDANLSLVLGAAQTWSNRSTGTLTANAIAGGTNTLTLSGVAGLTGTGNFALTGALSGSGGLTLSTPGTVTLTAANGYTGATAVTNGSTLALSGAAGSLTGTSGITLSNGNLTLTNAVGESAVNRIVDAAGITTNGGTLTWINPSGDNTANWAETLGTLSLNKGQTNVVVPNAVNSARTQTLTLGAGSLTHAAANTSTIAFAGATLGTATNRINVTSATATAANQIIGPWATIGSTAAAQTDYAVYSATTGISARNVANSAETTWTNTANSYTTTSTTPALTATRTPGSLRYNAAAGTLALGASSFDLQTFGLLNGGSGTLTVTNTGTGAVTTPTGGDNTLFIIPGSAAITFSTATIKDNGTPVHVVKGGANTLTFSAANSYTGATTINSGTLSISTTGNGGAASTLGASSAAATNLILAGGTLTYSAGASTPGSTDRLFTLTEAGGTINNGGGNNNALTFAGTGSLIASGTGDRTLTLNNNGTGNFTFSPVIVNPSSGTTSLVTSASGTGVIVLLPTSANTFTGGITIQNRTLQVQTANGWGNNVISFGSGTTPTLELRANAATTFATTGGLNFGNNTGTVTLSAVSASGGVTHTIGAISIGSGTFNFARGTNLNANATSSLTTGTVTLSGNPTFNLNAGSGTAAYNLNIGGLDDGGVARTITVGGAAAGTGRQHFRLFNNLTNFTAGTNIVYTGGNVGGIRLDTGNSFGTAANPGLVTFAAPSTVGGLRLLNNTANTNFTTNWVTGDNSILIELGGTSGGQNSKGLISGSLSIGTSTLTLNGSTNLNANNVYSLTLGATTFTGNSTLNVANVNGTAVGSLTLGALNDGAVARTLTKSGGGTLQLNSAATSIVAGTILTNTAGIVQIGNNTAFGSGTLRLGDGTTSSQLVVSNGITVPNSTVVTYAGGYSTLTTGAISGPTTGTGTINSTININATTAADTGHFQGGGGTLNITGPIVTGGTSNNEVIIRAGNVGLNNASGNTYTSLRVNAGTTTLGVDNAIPTSANLAVAELGAATLSLGGFNQTINSGTTWTFGGTGPTLENNVGTLATGAGTLTLNGTIANNTGSLATQLVTGAISFGGTSGTFNIDSGHATSDMTVSANLSNGSLIKDGAGILTLTGTKTLTSLTVNAGAVVGGFGTSGVSNITIGANGSLQLVNSVAESLTLANTAGSLNVAGGARIGLELGAPGTSDMLIVGAGGTASTSGTITLDFYNLGALAAGTYNLFTADSGLTAGGTTYNVGSAPLGFNYNIVATDSLVQLTTTAYTPRFWTGSQATTSWNTVNAGPVSNWSTDAAGTLNSTDVPNSLHTVIFSAANATGPTISTTLDAAFTVDAMQFLSAPAGVTAVTIGAGSGGALTIAPATSSAGIYVDSNAGTATLSAGLPFTASAAQTWNVVGGGANGSALVIDANVAFNAGVTKSGAGALTLNGSNTGSSNLTLSAGTINLNSPGALGAGTFIINGGTTIDNTGAGANTLTANNPIRLNGNFTFTGTQSLNLGTGAVSLPTNVSITTSANTLALNGAITQTGGARSLTKLGAGALTLGGNNTFSGGVNLSAGTLNVNNAGALGTGTLAITGGTLDNTSGAAITNSNNNTQNWNGNFAFTGTNNLNLGTGAVSLGASAGTSRTVTVNSGTLEVGGAISNGAVGTGITKAGAGTLTLSGASTYTGNTVVQAGTLNVTGSLTGNTTASTLTYGTVAGLSTVNVSGNITQFNMQGANIANAVSIYNQTAGTVTLSPGTGNIQYASNVAGGYGYMNLTGGTLKANQRFIIANGGTAVARVSGTASIDHTNAEFFMVTQNGSVGELTVLSGGSVDHTGSSNPFHTTLNQSNAFGLINLAGGTITTGAQSIRAGNSTSSVITNNNSMVNLASGTLSTGGGFSTSFGGTGTVANYYINFAGATVRTTAAVGTFIPASSTTNPQTTVNTTLFGAIDNSAVSGAPSFNGGLIFDTNGFNSGINQPILGAHTAAGLRQADIASVTGGSGYSGPPVLQFSTAGVVPGGTPAAGYALVSGGVVTGIVITNPGTYTAGTVPTVSLSGGGGTGASVTLNALNTSNLVAGVTKNGTGTLTLSSTGSSYFGPVVINGGTVSVGGGLANIGSNSPLGTGDATSTATNAASIVLNGGTLATNIGAATTTDRLFTVTQNGGTLESNNTTAANTITYSNTNAIAYSGSGVRTLTFGGANPVGGTNTFAPLIGNAGSDAVTLQKTGVSNWHLTNASNAYTGGTNIAAGVLTFNSGALGTTGNVTFTGSSALRWGTGVTDDMSSRLFITDTFTGTVDTNGNNVTFANAVGTMGGTTGILRKDGAGALTLNAAATHTGGTTLNAGTLNIGNAAALGSGTFTVSGTSTIDNTTGSSATLTGNPVQAWNGNFTFTGTNDLNLGTGATTINATRTITVSAGTLTSGGIIDDGVGNFGITKAGTGTLYLKGVNTFGADSNVTIQGGTLIVDAASGLGDATNNILFSTAAGTLRFTDNATFGNAQYFRTTNVAATIEVDSGKLVEIQGGPTGSGTNGINGSAGAGVGASIVKTGLGTLRISGSNSFFDGDGGWVVTQGTLSLAGNNVQVLGDNTAAVALRLNGGTVSYDTDTPNIVDAAIGTFLQASSTVNNNLATAGAGIAQRLNALTVQGDFILNVLGGTNVTSGIASVVAGATTLNGSPTFNITDPINGGATQLTLGAVTGNANSMTLTGNGDFTQTGAFAGSAANYLTLGSTFSGTATLSQANTYSGTTTVNGGSLLFSSSGNLGDASANNDINLGGGLFNYTGAGTVDLTANRQINLTTGTTSTIEVTNSTGVLQNTGGVVTSGAANLTKTGLGTLTVTGPLNLNGGNVSVSAGTLVAGLSASGVGGVSVATGGTLNLYDGAANTAAITALTLGSGSFLGFDLGAPGTNDIINLTGAPVISPTVNLNFNNLGGLAAGNYDLLNITSGSLNASDFILGIAPSGFNYNFTTVNANQTLRLTTSTLSLRYWQGDIDGSWSTLNAGPITNWATDLAGTTDLGALPAATDTLVFSTTNATGPALVTTLDGNFTADSLQFTSNPTGVTSVAVNQGTSGTLTLAPVSSNNGISVASNAGAITIGAPVVAGANQSWEVIGTGANGSSLNVSGNVTYTGSVTKTGAGALTIGGNNTGAGGFVLAVGTVNLNSATAIGTGNFAIESGTTFTNGTAGALTLSTNNTQTWNGSYTFGGTQDLNLGTGAVTMGNNLTATTSTNTLTVGGAIDDGASTYALTKAGAGTLILNGANGYDGLTNLTGGTLTLAGNNAGAAGGVTMAATTTLNINNAAALGSGTFTINGGTINNTSGAAITSSTNNAQNWNSSYTFTGAQSLNLGTGAVALSVTPTVTVSANTLTVGGAITGGFGITKAGAGTLVLSGLSTTAASNYIGTTTLDGGTTTLGADASLTGGLTIGATNTSTNTSTLNLGAASATFAGAMLVQTNTATANTISIGAGKALTNNANVTIGTGGTGTATRLNVSGSGAWNVSGTGLTFRLGGSSSAAQSAILDMTGLATFNANLGSTGALRVGSSETATSISDGAHTLTLATNSTITAGTLDIGSSTAHTVNGSVLMGAGTTTLNVNSIDIGSRDTAAGARRSSGSLSFASAAGSVIIRAADGVGASAINLVNSNSQTGAILNADLLLAGHSADVLASTVTMMLRNPAATTTTQATLANLTFDQGTFTSTSLVMSNRSGASYTSGTTTANATFGGGTSSLGTVTMSQNSVSTANSTGDAISTLTLNGNGTNSITTLNMGNNTLSGATATGGTQATLVHGGTATTTIGTLNLGVNSATAAVGTTSVSTSTISLTGGTLNVTGNLNMATTTANANNQSNGAINITGGTLTVDGNIQYTNGVGLETNSITLNGGTLDLTNGNVGAAGATITFNAQSGQLQNVAQINGGAGLTKTSGAGTNTLILEGTNTYTGNTVVSSGTLQLGSGLTTGSMAPTSAISVASGATFAVRQSDTVTQGTEFSAAAITGAGGFTQAGSGTTVLNAANSYTGATNVFDGRLQVGAAGVGSSGTGLITAVKTGATYANAPIISGSGTLQGAVVIGDAGTPGNRGILAPGDGNTTTSNATLTITAAGGLNIAAGSQTQLGITAASGTDLAFAASGLSASAYLASLGSTSDTSLTTPAAWANQPTSGQADFIKIGNGVSTGAFALGTNGGFATAGQGIVSIFSNGLDTSSLAAGQLFNLVDWYGTFTGGFNVGSGATTGGIYGDFDLPDISSTSFNWDTSAFASHGVIAVVNVIPEPSRAMLMLLGLLALGFRRRRIQD
jgi:autotransporter-associated beta strand protein